MTRACLSLLAGMYALQLSSFTSDSDYLSVAFVAAFLLFFLRQICVFVCFAVGVTLFLFAATELINSRISEDIAGDSIVVVVNVVGFASKQASNVSFIANPVADERLPHRIRLSWFEPPVNVHNGDSWQLEVRLRRPRGNRNPGGFDYESWLFRERIAAVGYVVGGRRNHLLGSNPGGVRDRIRKRFVSRVADLISDEQQASILVALVVGTRHLISQEQWDRYAVTGTSHLMAISGLHIGLAAGIVYFVALFAVGISRSTRNGHRVAVLISITVAILYAALSGFAIPARRASLMLALAGIALLSRRQPSLASIVSAACIAISIADPLSTMTPGFILSFAAVAILLWVGRRSTNLVTLQLMLLCGLLPFTAILFDRISFAALPVNLLAVPLFSFVVVPLSLLGMLLDGPLQLVGDTLLRIAGGGVALLETALSIVARYDWASFSLAALVGVAWLYIVLPTLWVLLPPGWPGRYLAGVGIGAILMHDPAAPEAGCASVDVLDVGHGLAVVARTRKHVLLYDSGPSFRGGGSAADSVLLPYLQSRGIRKIDQMIISHADLDHAGGVSAILAALPVARILSGEPLPGSRSVPCRAGQQWSNDGVSFQFLHPNLGTSLEGNDRSCVLLLQIGGYRMIFTGDIEKQAEQSLLRRQLLQAVDVVIVPHHGSRTSSSTAFVEALQPSIAVVSTAFGNHWGFPKAEVVERWEAAGADVLNTATSGAIELRICAATGIESIGRYRHDNRRIWHE